MKNIQALLDKDEIHSYIRNLWRTDIFRDSHDDSEDGYIHKLVDLLAERPVLFFEMNDPSIEWSQFTTWMGAYALRPGYENDTVHDLYYLHEFMHGATMGYDGDLSFVQWHRKMCENEMQASVHSEAHVYFQLEGLREQSFDFEIWVDRYLAVDATLATNIDEAAMLVSDDKTTRAQFHLLSVRRKEVMKSPDPFDFLEMQIHYYAMQNMQWSNIWKNSYREVEAHMESYLEEAKKDPESAVANHIDWFQKIVGIGHVTPYQEEAKAFAEIVKANKARQGNEILKG